MISKKVIDLINEQIREEFESEFIYLAMAVWATRNGYQGTAEFMTKQAAEEHGHAMKFVHFLDEIDGTAIIPALSKPGDTYKSLLHVFESGYNHEKHITACIHKLVALAEKEKDYVSSDFLQWYVSEQVEEEKNFRDIVTLLAMAGDSPQALLMIDARLGS